MKPPPFLLSITLLFWGWQSDLFLPSALMAVILESARVFKSRWDFSEDDFSKAWSFCSLVLLAVIVFSFTNNDGPSSFANLLDDMRPANTRSATNASAQTAAQTIRWLPMIFFPFLAAQVFSTSESIPLTTISLIMRRRWRKAKQLGQPAPAVRGFNVGYPYFCTTLLAASFHPSEDNSYFWGFCALLTWVLWTQRSRRFSIRVWIAVLAVAATAGYFGQRSVTRAQAYLTLLNSQWLANFMRRPDDPFQNRTAFGYVGHLKLSGQIVIRLQPDKPKNIPPYLREASYRLYRTGTWFAGSSRDDFSSISEEQPLPSGNWPLLPEKRNASRINIACYLEGYSKGSSAGLLPLPTGVTRLEKLNAFIVDTNSAGSVLAHGPGLVMFDAIYGPGATIDSPPTSRTNLNTRGRRLFEESGLGRFEPVTEGETSGEPRRFVFQVDNEDLAVPPSEKAALNAVITELNLRKRPLAETLQLVQQFFNDKFKYSMWQAAPRSATTNQTPLARFLLTTRSGHCEYFATATALLLRELGIPARYATGYSVHEESGDGYVVRLSDAHAWTLVWDEERKQWFDFDTTPASWVEMEKKNRSPLSWLKDAWSRLKFEFSRLRNGQTNLRSYLLWIILPGMLLLLYQIVFRRGRKRRKDQKSDAAFLAILPGLDSDFYKLEKKISARGLTRGTAEPLNLWLQRVEKSAGMESLREPLRELLKLHYRHRFDPHGLNAADRETLKAETRRCLELLETTHLSARG
jgi:protein-glutamine gamma-glutamyltransferase